MINKFHVDSAYTVCNIVFGLALAINLVVFIYIITKIEKKKQNLCGTELNTDLPAYQQIKDLAEYIVSAHI